MFYHIKLFISNKGKPIYKHMKSMSKSYKNFNLKMSIPLNIELRPQKMADVWLNIKTEKYPLPLRETQAAESCGVKPQQVHQICLFKNVSWPLVGQGRELPMGYAGSIPGLRSPHVVSKQLSPLCHSYWACTPQERLQHSWKKIIKKKTLSHILKLNILIFPTNTWQFQSEPT